MPIQDDAAAQREETGRLLDAALPGLGEVYVETWRALVAGYDEDVTPHIERVMDRLGDIADTLS